MQQQKIEAPTTGTIWKIERQVGDKVQEGDVVLIMESMKMEIPVEAPAAGTLASLNVAEGEAVEEGALLAQVAP